MSVESSLPKFKLLWLGESQWNAQEELSERKEDVNEIVNYIALYILRDALSNFRNSIRMSSSSVKLVDDTFTYSLDPFNAKQLLKLFTKQANLGAINPLCMMLKRMIKIQKESISNEKRYDSVAKYTGDFNSNLREHIKEYFDKIGNSIKASMENMIENEVFPIPGNEKIIGARIQWVPREESSLRYTSKIIVSFSAKQTE